MAIEADKTLEELFKFRLGQLKSDSEYATGVISQHVRVVSYALIALVIPLVTAEPGKQPELLRDSPNLALLCAALGFVAVIFDWAQNHFMDRCARQEFARIVDVFERNSLRIDDPADFMMRLPSSTDSRLRDVFFRLKIIVALAGVLSFAMIMGARFT